MSTVPCSSGNSCISSTSVPLLPLPASSSPAIRPFPLHTLPSSTALPLPPTVTTTPVVFAAATSGFPTFPSFSQAARYPASVGCFVQPSTGAGLIPVAAASGGPAGTPTIVRSAGPMFPFMPYFPAAGHAGVQPGHVTPIMMAAVNFRPLYVAAAAGSHPFQPQQQQPMELTTTSSKSETTAAAKAETAAVVDQTELQSTTTAPAAAGRLCHSNGVVDEIDTQELTARVRDILQVCGLHAVVNSVTVSFICGGVFFI